MTLNKQVDLYHGKGKAPIRGDTKLQAIIDTESQFCAVFDSKSAFKQDHNIAMDLLFERYGIHPGFPDGWFIRPFLVNQSSLVAFPQHLVGMGTAALLKDTGYHVGGFFFDEGISGFIITDLKTLGYTINEKYDKLRGLQ